LLLGHNSFLIKLRVTIKQPLLCETTGAWCLLPKPTLLQAPLNTEPTTMALLPFIFYE
jgi:hypothetical protein